MTADLFVVPCGRAKLDHPAPARLLYSSPHFRWVLDRVTAAAATRPVRILSARHGLVHPHRVLDPYDTTITDPDAARADVLADQLGPHLPGRGQLVVHAFLPIAYLNRLFDGLVALGRAGGWIVRDYYAGRGIGGQRHIIATLPAGGGHGG